MGKIKSWYKLNKKEFWILLTILAVGAFLRLYKIDQYMTFLGDEGRDVLIVRRIFTELHPPLIGPGTSVGQMYLGPLYYYMMAPALFIANFSPVGPAVQIALLGILTVWLVWFIAREWFGKTAGLVAATLYAISPTVITFSHSSWNPNIMPFFALLSIYSIWKVWQEKEFNWLIVLGISFASVMQSHYLGVLLAPTLFLFWILKLMKLKQSGKFIIKSILGFLIFLGLMSPLLLFDLRHNFQNYKAFQSLFEQRGGVWVFTMSQVTSQLIPRFNDLVSTMLGAKNNLLSIGTTAAIIFIGLFLFLIRSKKVSLKKYNPAFLILGVWIGIGILGFSFYKLPIYDHYFGFLFPAPFILIGGFIEIINSQAKFVGKAFTFLLLLALIIINLLNNPLRYQPNKQLQRSQNVSRFILGQANKQPFDLAVLAERNYEDGYRYFLELWGGTVLHADRWDQRTIVDQLFVVCEEEEKKCDPTHSPKAEIANFGMTKVESQWNVDGVIIYKLIHTK